jgi:peptide deformylase
MAIREIIYTDNPVLRQKARKVARVTRTTQTLIDDMIATMRAASGVGLAAPQVAVGERVIVVEPPPDEDDEQGEDAPRELYAVVNPEIVKVSSEQEEDVEGCLSIPGWAGMVDRYLAIVVRGLDRRGEPVRYRLNGYTARIFQHEIDHLNGVLFIDRVSDPKKIWRVDARGEPLHEPAGESAGEPAGEPAGESAEAPAGQPAERPAASGAATPPAPARPE